MKDNMIEMINEAFLVLYIMIIFAYEVSSSWSHSNIHTLLTILTVNNFIICLVIISKYLNEPQYSCGALYTSATAYEMQDGIKIYKERQAKKDDVDLLARV